jgi:hypothetical protein
MFFEMKKDEKATQEIIIEKSVVYKNTLYFDFFVLNEKPKPPLKALMYIETVIAIIADRVCMIYVFSEKALSKSLKSRTFK